MEVRTLLFGEQPLQFKDISIIFYRRMTSLYWLCVSLIVGGVGGILFATGLLLPMDHLVGAGIGLICASVVGLLINYVYCLKPAIPSVQTQQTQSDRPRYSTNNMSVIANSMKRNKSDTDLELINKQSEAAESGEIV